MATQQQDPSKNPYALQIEPFSPALQPQAYESTAPPTVSGSGGKVEGGAMVADRFLEGFSRGRKMAFDRQEQERSRLNQDINEAYGRVDRSDLPDYSDDPNAITKATLHGRLDALKYADMYQEVHKSKDKDNPAIKTLKGVFEGLVGPPKKDFKFGPEQVHQTLSGIWGDMDKAQTGKQLAEKEAQGLSQYMAGVEGQQGTTPPPAQAQPQAAPQEQKPNILPYGPGAQTAPPPGGPPPQGAPQPQQAAPQSSPAPQAQTQQPPVQQQMPTAMRQQAPQPAPTQSAPAPNQPQPGQQNKDPLADPEFMRRYQRLAALDPKNPLVGMISKRIEERDKNKASKSLAEDIKGIPGKDILEGNPNAKTAFGGPVKEKSSYVQGKDDKLYPVDLKAATKPHNLQRVWAVIPGKDGETEVYIDPQDPQADLVAVGSGEIIPREGVTTKPIGVLTADERLKYYGSYGDYYRAAIGRGLTNTQAMADASQKLYTEKGIRLGRTQQEEAMDQALSGIGAPNPFKGQTGPPPAAQPSAPPANATPPGGVTPKPQTGATPPQAQPQVTAPAATTLPATPPARSATPPAARTAPRPAAQPTPAQNAATAQENRNIDIYLADLMGNSKFSGKGASIAKMNGMEALAKRAGVSPAEFQTAAAVDKDKIKALGDTVLRYGAIQRLNSIMDRFGPNLEKLAKEIPQTGSPLLNKAWRDIKLNAVDDPKIREYLIALNDFDRQYGTITAGGGLSKAMLPVSTQESVTKLLNPNATLGGVLGMISQIKTQARLEQEGMQDSLTKMRDEIHGSVLGTASRNQNQTTPPPAAPTAIDAAKKKYNIQY